MYHDAKFWQKKKAKFGLSYSQYVAFAHSIYSWQTSESIYNKVHFEHSIASMEF